MIDSVSAIATANYASQSSRFEPPSSATDRQEQPPPVPGAASSTPAADTRDPFVTDRVEQAGRSELGIVPQESPVRPPYVPFFENIASFGNQQTVEPPPVEEPVENQASRQSEAPRASFLSDSSVDDEGVAAAPDSSSREEAVRQTEEQQAFTSNAEPAQSVQDLVLKLYDLPA